MMRVLVPVVLLLTPTWAMAQSTASFEDLSVPPEGYYNGSDFAGGFSSGGVFFNNAFTDFGGGFTAWSGFSYSNHTDVTTPGFGNQYSAYHLPGGGGDGSPNYGVAFAFSRGDAFITWGEGLRPVSVRLTNTTYAALSMRDGDGFGKQFGGPSGNDPDFFEVTLHGLDSGGGSTGSVTFALADYRFADNSLDYIVERWTTVDLAGLSTLTRRIELEFASSDVGQFGINTPTYVALDNLQLAAIPEPGTLGLVASVCGAGAAACRMSRRKPRR